MKKKTKIIISIIVFLILIALALTIIILTKNNKEPEKSYTKKEIIEKISNGFVNGISKNELESLMNQEVQDKAMMTGEDAYLLQTPSDKLIDKYNLNNYVKDNKAYFSNLEKKIKENYTWKFDDEVKDNQDTYFINVKTYNYGVYLADLEEIVGLLTNNYPFKNSEEQEINNYKARVIAMKLLDSHLDDYISSSDPKSIAIFFKGVDSKETKDSLSQYLIDLSGYANGLDERINNMEINRTERMRTYINEAISNGTLDQNDILKL